MGFTSNSPPDVDRVLLKHLVSDDRDKLPSWLIPRHDELKWEARHAIGNRLRYLRKIQERPDYTSFLRLCEEHNIVPKYCGIGESTTTNDGTRGRKTTGRNGFDGGDDDDDDDDDEGGPGRDENSINHDSTARPSSRRRKRIPLAGPNVAGKHQRSGSSNRNKKLKTTTTLPVGYQDDRDRPEDGVSDHYDADSISMMRFRRRKLEADTKAVEAEAKDKELRMKLKELSYKKKLFAYYKYLKYAQNDFSDERIATIFPDMVQLFG